MVERRWRTAGTWLRALFYFNAVLLQWPCLATTPDNNVDSTIARDCRVFEGDICISDKQWKYLNRRVNPDPAPLGSKSDSHTPRRGQRAVVKLELLKWIDGVVPYVLADDLSTAASNAIRAAMDQFMLDSCIRFIPKTSINYDYLYFFSGNGCYSSIGRRGGRQNISIGSTCVSKGVVMHEIFHALGRWHEQSRPDRDRYIAINAQNINPDFTRNFQLVDESMSTTNDVSYDYDSIMHYDAYAFSRNDRPTIEPLDDSISLDRLGQRTHLSKLDLDHIKELYCQDRMPTNEWSTWSSWGECSSTCGEGKQTRTRTCIGGDQCPGSGSESRNCSMELCPTIAAVPSWGPWSEWSGCSHTCGGGNRLRLRSCLDGDFCEGNSTDYEECNTQECPSKWGEWSIWSECSKSCDEGVRYRRRECLPGLHCTGPVKEEEPCNVNITCEEWSGCSRECGGGVQWRLDSSGEIINRTCNEQHCHNETCLQGVRHIGCYRLSHSRLKMYEKMTRDLSDSPTSRTEPVRKCGTASLDQGNTYFSLGEGICFSGSNQISDYIGGGESQSCSGGRGNYFGGQFVIDVYHIDDAIAFQDSSTACVACGKDYCSEPDLQSNWRLMCSVSSTHHILPTVSVILFLVLCLLLL